MRIITAITNATVAQVTTSFAHDYLDGEIVRLYIPDGFGMVQADKHTGTISVTGATTFTIDLDTSTYDQFVIPPENPGHFYTSAHVVPLGEVNQQLRAATKNVLRSVTR